MKKKAFILLLVLLPLLSWGQGKVYTKKARLQNYASKTTKIVLPDNPMLSTVLQNRMAGCWTLTAFEFCTEKEYESLKENKGYFFLRLAVVGSEDGDGILTLIFEKGGKPGNQSAEGAFEVVSIPVSSSPSGLITAREEAMIPVLVDVIQQFTVDASNSDRVAYAGLPFYGTSPVKLRERKILFCEKDVCQETAYTLSSEDEMVKAIEAREPGTAVSFVVAPYKMIIGADDHKLLWYQKPRRNNASVAGFTESEISTLTRY